MGKKILVVEDDVILRDILASKLSKEGFETLSAEDGEQALALLRSAKPDLVLLDILIPKKTGIEVLTEMRADPALREIRVIAISNSGDQAEIKQVQALGVQDFLVKAIFDSGDVVQKVEEALGHSVALGNPSGILTEAPAVPETTPAPVAPEPAEKPAPTVPPAAGSGGKVVLIVEDDKFLRELAAQKLRNEGFTVMEATSGDEALELMKSSTPNIAVLDLILPGMTGFDILTKMKQNPSLKNVPVIILSNLGQEEDIEKAKALGATDYLVKAHFSFGEIIKKIRTVLGE